MNLDQVTLPTQNIADSADFYRRMGFTQIVDSPHYARFDCPTGDGAYSAPDVTSRLNRCTTLALEHDDSVFPP